MLDLENVLCFYADIKPVLDDKAQGSGRDWKEQTILFFPEKKFPLPTLRPGMTEDIRTVILA